ncbi:MAG: capsule assembly Wzi family protein [Treponema sp.]|nr:capsule assembly Wzi family protein [Treponema sp.]
MKKRVLVLLLALTVFTNLTSQEKLKSLEEEYYDFLALQGLVEKPSMGFRTLSDSVWNIDEDLIHPWADNNLGTNQVLIETNSQSDNFFTRGIFKGLKLKVYGPEWFNSYNTNQPYGQNDGALWQGVGYNTSLTTGLKIEAFGFEATFKPQFTFSQNKDFTFQQGVYGSEYSYFWTGNIDLVQRYGNTSYWQYDWGDSEIRYSWHTLTLGFGTQSMWLGPAKLNPMLSSNNAGTFPKLDFGLRKTDLYVPFTNIKLGQLESRIWIAQLTESQYFNNDGVIEKNLFNGFNISFSPAFWDDLTIGATKVCVTKWGNNFWKYINPFYDDNDVNGTGEDQKGSIYLDITIPQFMFEFYAEVGFDDYSREFIANPFHTTIFTLGLVKGFKLGKENKYSIKFYSELNFFEMTQDFQLQWPYMGFYSHGQISQGYTQNGQIIGAGSGYFGNSQLIGLQFIFPKGNFDIFLHRNAPAVNYIYNMAVNDVAANLVDNYWTLYETFLTLGFKGNYFVSQSFIINAEIDYTYIFHYHHIQFAKANNFRFVLGAKYNF